MNTQRVHRNGSCWCGHDGASHYGRGEESASFACRECDRPREIDRPQLQVEDRRRFERFGLPHPIRTSVANSPAYVVDASLAGLGVLHHKPAPPVGTTCRLMFHSEFGPIALDCEVVRTAADRHTETPGETTFQTGLRIVAADQESEARLRELMMALALPFAAPTRPAGH